MSRYIDADLLKQSIPSTKMDEFENCRYCRLLDEEQVKDLIDEQPTADVRENVKGEWQVREEIENNCYIVRCSNCHAKVRVGGNVLYDSKIELNNFCPNCGADMRGEA